MLFPFRDSVRRAAVILPEPPTPNGCGLREKRLAFQRRMEQQERAMARKAVKLKFEGKDLEHYNALMQAREMVVGIMKHNADALDCSNADKRGATTHMADISSDNSRHEMELRMLTEEGDVLTLIEDAIKRLVDGEYGRCQECGEMISEGRLAVRPYAIYCIKCKERHERSMRE